MSLDYIKFAWSAGELSSDLLGRNDLENFTLGFRDSVNMFVDWRGSLHTRPGTEFCDKLFGTKFRLFSFSFSQEPEDNSLLIFTGRKMYVVENGEYVDLGTRTSVSRGTLAKMYRRGRHVDTVKYTGQIADYFRPLFSLEVPYQTSQLKEMHFSQYRDEVIITHPDVSPHKLIRTLTSWKIEKINYEAPSTISSLRLSYPTRSEPKGADNNGYVGFKVVGIKDGLEGTSLGVGGLISDQTNIATNNIQLDWRDSNYQSKSFSGDFDNAFSNQGTDFFRIYATIFSQSNLGLNGNRFGFIADTINQTFTYELTTPDFSVKPLSAFNPFASENPRSSGLFQQRRIYASTKENPATIFASTIRHHQDFSTSESATSSFEFDIDSKELNTVFSIVDSYRGVFLFSPKSIWILRPEGDGGINVGNAINEKEQESGADPNLQPLRILNSILYMSTLDRTPRAIIPSPTPNYFDNEDLGLYSSHFFKKRIVQWAYAGRPHRVLWAVREDGVLLSCTYAPDHGVAAWAKHKTRGLFKDVAVVVEEDIDRVYFVIERDGQNYIERFTDREEVFEENQCPLDFAVRYTGRVGGIELKLVKKPEETYHVDLPLPQGIDIKTPYGRYRHKTEREYDTLRKDTEDLIFGTDELRTFQPKEWRYLTEETPAYLPPQVDAYAITYGKEPFKYNGEALRGYSIGEPFDAYVTTLPIVPDLQGGQVINKPKSIVSCSLRLTEPTKVEASANGVNFYDVPIGDGITPPCVLAANWNYDTSLTLKTRAHALTLNGIVIEFEFGQENQAPTWVRLEDTSNVATKGVL